MNDEPKPIEESDAHPAPPQDLLSSEQTDKVNLETEKLDLEIEKLNHEIENLRKKNKWESITPLVLPILSVLTVVVSVVGLGLGFRQFQDQQSSLQTRAREERERERTRQIQNQLRSDVDEISRFTQDKTETISRLSFLVDDMNIIMSVTVAEGQSTQDQSSEAFRSYERSVTKSLVEQIVNDTDFMQKARDVSFANTISKNWRDYQNYLEKEQLETLEVILYKYVRALRYLRERNESYFNNQLSYDEKTQSYSVSNVSEKKEGEEILYQHIKYLLEGFKEHLNLISADQKALVTKKRTIDAFVDAVCNARVAKHILGEADFVCRPCITPVLPECSGVLCCPKPTK